MSSSTLCALVVISMCVAATMATRAGAGDLELVLVQLTHRHGARSPLVSANQSIICPTPGGCGILNAQGKDMLKQLGSYIRNRYNTAEGTWFRGTAYDPEWTYSRSTDIMRTIQSADGVLHGLYPDVNDFYPYVNTVSLWNDDLLLVNALSAFDIPATVLKSTVIWPKVGAYAIPKLFTFETLRAVGKELNLDALCSKNDTAAMAHCALELQDEIEAYHSTGELLNYTLANELQGKFNDVRYFYNSLMYPYDKNNAVDVARGSLGQNLAQQMITNMRLAIDKNVSYGFYEYSAHDTTMMPFCSTLGHNEAMRPPFGQMYLIDLLRNTTSNRYVVRQQQGYPGQGPVDHTYNISPFALKCMDGNGNVYTVEDIDGTCPMEDWARFIDSSKPQNPAGLCYLDQDIIDAIGCDMTDVAPENKHCAFYRYHCSQYACPTGFYYDPVDFSCQAIVTKKTEKSISNGVIVAIVFCSVFGGILLGFAAARIKKGSSSDSQYQTMPSSSEV